MASKPATVSEISEVNLSTYSNLTRAATGHGVLRTGLIIGLAGGLAEIVVIWLYSVLTGGDSIMIARHVASAIGLDGAPAAIGVVVHMGLAMILGIALSAGLQIFDRPTRNGALFSFMVGSLAVVWVINYFVVLPAVSPSFVHLLPYAITLASKLAFGLAAAATLHMLPVPLLERQIADCRDESESACGVSLI
jgi:hypothetical protein